LLVYSLISCKAKSPSHISQEGGHLDAVSLDIARNLLQCSWTIV